MFSSLKSIIRDNFCCTYNNKSTLLKLFLNFRFTFLACFTTSEYLSCINTPQVTSWHGSYVIVFPLIALALFDTGMVIAWILRRRKTMNEKQRKGSIHKNTDFETDNLRNLGIEVRKCDF